DVLGYRAAEVAAMLETTDASVNSLLRRARAALEERWVRRERAPAPDSPAEREIVGRFAESVESGDVDGMVALLADDAWLTMPPLPHAYQGPEAIGAFLQAAEERRGGPLQVRLARANGQPAFVAAAAAFVLTLSGDRISAITFFSADGVAARFGLT